MRLSAVLPKFLTLPSGAPDPDVTAITAASNAVEPGAIFAALPGVKTDGANYVPDAIKRGARAIIASPGKVTGVPDGVALIETENPRRALALIAAKFFEPQPDTIVAVTGTSGKTSVADFTRQIFAACGHQAASVGTIGVVKPSGAVYGSLTTPDPVTLHATLQGLAKEGVTHVAMEASSHGLDQNRLDGVRLAAAAFTNLGRDHMDYHPTVEHYFHSKMRLFTELLGGWPAAAVINMDSGWADRVLNIVKSSPNVEEIFTVGAKGDDFKLLAVERTGFRQRLKIRIADEVYEVVLPLVGTYQVENALVALALACATGKVGTGEAVAALNHLKGVSGRLEIVGEARGGLSIVDYAHKPEALVAALDACRPFVTGKLICVFGCGGDRDKGKRPIMGKIAADKADVVIVTDDNPRTEVPSAIRAEILAAAPGAREIGDRAEAIAAAVAMMGEGDVVLVAGKGHETGQIVGNTVKPFSDHDELRRALERS